MNKLQRQNEYCKRINAAMNFITEHADRDLSLDEIAKVAMFSKYHFHRIFKAIAGETVAEFIRRVKLQKSANILLFNPNIDITTIALDCGFSSSQNFAKAFKKYYNQSPSEFRKNPRDNPHSRNSDSQNSKHGNIKSNQVNASSPPQTYHAKHLTEPSFDVSRSLRMNIQIEDMPTYPVAYIRTYGLSNETCSNAFQELMQWAKPRNLQDGERIGLCWDNPEVTPSEKCRFDACIALPGDYAGDCKLSQQKINGGKYAVGKFEINKPEKFGDCWDTMFLWLSESGYQPADKPPYQIMHSSPEELAELIFRFEICIPIQPL